MDLTQAYRQVQAGVDGKSHGKSYFEHEIGKLKNHLVK
jgi:hypothetical protein